MRTRFLLPAVLAAWAVLLAAPHDAEARRIPSRALDMSQIGDHPIDSDPWVPDGSMPTKTLAAPGEAVLDEGSPAAKAPRAEAWTRFLLRFLRMLAIGGPVR